MTSRLAIDRWYLNAFLASIAFYAVFLPSRVLALDPQKGITQFRHQKWLAQQGIGDVYSISQTTDGYLWLATSNGTFRFDGVNFRRLEGDPVESEVVGITPYKLLGSRDGSLWITRGEKVVRILRGEATVYSEANGLPGGLVQSIREENDGSIWLAALSGISKFSAGRWQNIGTESGVPIFYPRTTFLDRNQNLWTVMFDRAQSRYVVALLRRGGTKFQLMGDAEFDTNMLAEAPDGRIWAAQWPRRTVRVIALDQVGLHFESPEINATSQNILVDREGSLWIGTSGAGLRRVRDPRSLGTAPVEKSRDADNLYPARHIKYSDAVDAFTHLDGLSNDHTLCIFEGREGEIWVGTSAGLDVFCENKFTSISAREGLRFDENLLLRPDRNEGIWAVSTVNGFEKIENSGQRVDLHGWFNFQKTEISTWVHCLYSDPQGDVFAGTSQGVFAIQKDGTSLGVLAGTEEPADETWNLRQVQAITRDNSGALWMCDKIFGVFRLQGHHLENVLPLGHKYLNPSVRTCHTDRAGRIWMGTVGESDEEQLACYEGGALHRYSTHDGLFPGRIECILSDASGEVWFAGRGGISRFRDGRFQTLTRQNGLPEDNLLSVLQDNDGFFWLAGRSGIFRVDSRELEKAMAPKSGRVSGEFFDVADGVRGIVDGPDGLGARVVAAKSADGRLWFPTSAGVTMIDPRHILKNQVPPQVHVQQIVANGKSYSTAGPLTLPVGAHDCEFDYIGLCFTNPDKVSYRYKLEGYDRKWVEAGSRRQAFYSNLKPGNYRFQVLACNNDGVWNETGDSVAFSLSPAIYERVWFPLVWLLPAALVLWGLHRLRLAQLAARMNLRLESQTVERKRIARELHDTLLQGFIGTGLKLDAIASNLPESLASVRDQLRKILDQSDQYLTDARRAVLELRSASLEKSDDLSNALSLAAKRLTEGGGIHLSYSVEGEQVKLAPFVESNLLRICEEAVSNAVRHGQPTRIEVAVRFGRKETFLRIRDDGCGFELYGPETAKTGHFGLVGMQERVKAMAGRLSLTSQPGKGTEIIVTVPAESRLPRRWFKNFS